jgi:outer membrane protein OmpA-like peptidoglycan-associated protein
LSLSKCLALKNKGFDRLSPNGRSLHCVHLQSAQVFSLIFLFLTDFWSFPMFSQDDDSHGWILGVVFGVVALVIALAIGVGIYQKNLKAKNATTAVATNSVATQAINTPAVAGIGSVSAVGTVAAGATAAMSDAAMLNAAQAAADAASVKVENGVVKFYFASGKSEVAAGGKEALADVVKAVAGGKKAVVSGYNDATGDAAKNAELSKQRAFAVRDALKGLGVAEDKIELKKPENTTAAAGSSSEARRVEVTIQ